MSAVEQFTGLPMPVFTAFGWTGETNALKFALAQMNTFIHALHRTLSTPAQQMLPFFGVDEDGMTAYLASNQHTEEGPYIILSARPTMFDVKLSITDKAALIRGLKTAETNPILWHRHLAELGPDWGLHFQQCQVDEESGSVSNYQDLYKEGISEWDLETCTSTTSRALFLTSEARWVTPLHINRRMRPEQASMMAEKLTRFLAADIDKLLPIIGMFGRPGKATKPNKKAGRPRTTAVNTAAPETKLLSTPSPITPSTERPEQFVYVAELKPLHIRKGFINLTPAHWHFFAESPRIGSRVVTLSYSGKFDKETTVWRLQPDEMARIVLSEKAQTWFEKQFANATQVKVTAARLKQDEIQIILSHVD